MNTNSGQVRSLLPFKTITKSKAVFSSIVSDIVSPPIETYITTPKPSKADYASYDKEFRVHLSDEMIAFHNLTKSKINDFMEMITSKKQNNTIESCNMVEYIKTIEMWENESFGVYKEPLKTYFNGYDYTCNIDFGKQLTLSLFGATIKEYFNSSQSVNIAMMDTKINTIPINNEEKINEYIKSCNPVPSYLVNYFDYKKTFLPSAQIAYPEKYSQYYIKQLQQNDTREVKIKIKPNSIKLSLHKKDNIPDSLLKFTILYKVETIGVMQTLKDDDLNFANAINLCQQNFGNKLTPPLTCGGANDEINKLIDELSKKTSIEFITQTLKQLIFEVDYNHTNQNNIES
jgi:hypothetical protein